MQLLRTTAPLLLVFIAACDNSGKSSDSDKTPAASQTDAGSKATDVDVLRDLPYAGSVEDDSGEDADGVVLLDSERSYPGYNLFSSHTLARADLVDEHGRSIKSWSQPDVRHWAHVELLANGDLLMTGADRVAGTHAIVDSARFLMRMNWDGEVVWKKMINAHHDGEQTPDGKILTLTFERRKVPEMQTSADVRDDHLTLLDKDGNLLESVSLLDLVRASAGLFRIQPVRETRQGNQTPWIDLFHCNTVEWMHRANLFDKDPIYAPTNVLVCSRHQDRVFIVNWQTKKIVWAWGVGEVSGPHDAQVLENGHILIFDNGLNREPKYSRVIELDPLTNKIVWQYKADPPEDFFTVSRGSNQRLPNGNTLIANSDHGEAFEVTSHGRVVWRFLNPNRDKQGKRGTIVRIRRYERAFIDKLLAEHDAG